MSTTAKCTLGPKHKWEYVKDVTITDIRMTAVGTYKTMRCRGLFKCACGARRHGQSKGGL